MLLIKAHASGLCCTGHNEIFLYFSNNSPYKSTRLFIFVISDTSSSPPGTSADQKAEGDAGEAAAGAAEGATAGPSKTEPELNEVPFQLLIKYTDLEGAQAMRCMTQNMPITHDRQLAEEGKGKPSCAANHTQMAKMFSLTSSRHDVDPNISSLGCQLLLHVD